ncbi:hypothetical protein [Streptodolium elevatio]|uniref:Uncharacterized protein n=1 Tax=Streptodolium elevatio TaxID=3157996 RepID=A0ABV3DG63_9ACTN
MVWGRRKTQHPQQPAAPRERDLVERMFEWHARADLAVAVEDFAAARTAQTLALDIATALAARTPDDVRAWQAIAATRYALIESCARTGDFAAALESADACLAAYAKVAESGGTPGGSGAETTALTADVRARRAVALAGNGQITAALLEADEAVCMYVGLGAEDWDSGCLPDLARVLSTVAPVRARYGEPDHAAATADYAIRLYVENAARINRRPDAPTHARCLFEAAQIASDLHAAAGRTDLALSAANVGRQTAAARRIDGFVRREQAYAGALARYTIRLTEDGKSDESEAFLAESCAIDPGAYARVAAEAYPLARARVEVPPLADALRAAQAMLRDVELPELLDGLLADPWSVQPSLSVPDRCPADVAPEIAETLAAAAVRMLGEGDPQGLRLCLEANVVFAGAAAREVPAMRHDFAAYGTLWAQALAMAAWRFHETGSEAFRWYAADLAAWLLGVLDRLAPLAAAQPDITELIRVGTTVARSVLDAKPREGEPAG